MTTTVREMVHEIQTELRSGEVLPSRARELLIQLTSLFGNCLSAVTDADAKYASVLLFHLDKELKANRAKIHAELSEEFRQKKEARDVRALVEEMIRSLKVLLKSQEEEMRLSR